MVTEPVGLSQNLPVRRVMRAQVGQTDLAIWRSNLGRLSAWGNRCPHRGMRLSHGFVRGEALACLYHGWHYNTAGRCRYIPAHPDLEPPETIMTDIYSIVEKHGVLWVSIEGEASATTLPDDLQAVRSITFECSDADALHVLMEMPLLDETGEMLTANQISPSPKIISYSSSESRSSVFILLQKPTEFNLAAHILATPDWTVDGLVTISRWSECVRRQAENPAEEQAANGRSGS